MDTIRLGRRVERVRHELKRRDVTVARVAPLGTGFIRVVFGGASLEGFTSLGFDDHVKLMLGIDGNSEPLRRDYSPRHFDPVRRELTIDFAVHGGGLASDWARHATVGQHAVIGGPRGSMIVPVDFDWHLLAGDATAAPAIGRRLAELPAGARAIVIAQLDDLGALECEQSAACIQLLQVTSGDDLVATLEALPLPSGEGFAWAAGEAASMARVRDLLLHRRGHPKEAMRVAAYWKKGASAFHEDLGR